MEIIEILKNTFKVGGLALLAFNLNSCSPQKGVVDGYMSAIMDEDVEEVTEYCTKKRARHINSFGVRMLKNIYEDYKLHSYIPREGKTDSDNVWWIERKDGNYNRVVLVIEDGEWKISDVSPPFRP